jgi:hypothetical protein
LTGLNCDVTHRLESAPLAVAPYQICAGESRSHFKRISLGQFAFFQHAGALQRFNRACFIDVNDCIEPFRQTCVKIMAQSLGLWPINHAERPHDPTLLQNADLAGTSQVDPEPRQTNLVKQIFVSLLTLAEHSCARRVRPSLMLR